MKSVLIRSDTCTLKVAAIAIKTGVCHLRVLLHVLNR